MAQLLRVDQIAVDMTPANGTDFTLAELYRFIGTDTIQIVWTTDGRLMVLDEHGKLKDRPINVAATRLYVHGADDPIVGDVVVCQRSEVR